MTGTLVPSVTVGLSITSVPAGWTATLSQGSMVVSSQGQYLFEVTVTPPAAAPTGTTAVIEISATQNGTTFQRRSTTVTVGTDLTTGIVKLTDFAPDVDGMFVSDFRVNNGAPGGLVTNLLFIAVPLVEYWYRPSADISLGVNATDEYELVAVCRDSSSGVGSHAVTASFQKDAVTHAYSSSFTVDSNSERSYVYQTIDSNIRHSLVGDTGTWQVSVTLPAGSDGNYALNIDNLHSSLSAVVTPPSVVVPVGGGTFVFDVVITRDVAHPGQGFAAYEPVFFGDHATRSQQDFRQTFPIRSSD